MKNIKKLTVIFFYIFCTLFSALAVNLEPKQDEKTGKWGYINPQSSFWEIKPKYEAADEFLTPINNDACAIVAVKGKYFLINTQGNAVGKGKYDSITPLDNKYGLKIVNGGKSGVMDFTGKVVIEPMYDDIKYFRSLPFYGSFLTIKKSGGKTTKGLVTSEGEIFLSPSFEFIMPFNDRELQFVVKKPEEETAYVIRVWDGKKSFENIPVEKVGSLTHVKGEYTRSNFYLDGDENQIYAFDDHGNQVIVDVIAKGDYTYVQRKVDNKWDLEKGNTYDIYDSKGHLIATSASEFVEQRGNYLLCGNQALDTEGKATPMTHTKDIIFLKDDSDRKWVRLDNNNNPSGEPYDSIIQAKRGLKTLRNGKWGVISWNGNVMDETFTEEPRRVGGYTLYCYKSFIDNNVGLLSSEMEELLPPVYKELKDISDFQDKEGNDVKLLIGTDKNGNKAVYNLRKENWITPFVKNLRNTLDWKIFYAEDGGKVTTYDYEGNVLTGDPKLTLSSLHISSDRQRFVWQVNYEDCPEEEYKVEFEVLDLKGNPLRVGGRPLIISATSVTQKAEKQEGSWYGETYCMDAIPDYNKHLLRLVVKDTKGRKLSLKDDRTIDFQKQSRR